MSFNKSLIVLLLAIGLAAGSGTDALAQQQRGADEPALRRYTVDARGWPLKQALEHLVDTTHISLIYDVAMVAGKRTACQAHAATPEALLHCILDRTGLEAERLASGTFVMRPARPQSSKPTASSANTVSGFIYDVESGDSLRDAAVYETAHRIGTTTNAAGHYRLRVPSDSARLAVSHLGYEEARFNLKLRGDVARDVGLNPAILWMDSLEVIADWDDEEADDSTRSRAFYQHVRGVYAGFHQDAIRRTTEAFFGYRFKGQFDLGVSVLRADFISGFVVTPEVGYATRPSKKGWGLRTRLAYALVLNTGPLDVKKEGRGFEGEASLYKRYHSGGTTEVFPSIGVFTDPLRPFDSFISSHDPLVSTTSEYQNRVSGVQVALPVTFGISGGTRLVIEPYLRVAVLQSQTVTNCSAVNRGPNAGETSCTSSRHTWWGKAAWRVSTWGGAPQQDIYLGLRLRLNL